MAIVKVNQIKAINEDSSYEFLEKPEHLRIMIKMNESSENRRRDYKIKDHNSKISADKVVLTV